MANCNPNESSSKVTNISSVHSTVSSAASLSITSTVTIATSQSTNTVLPTQESVEGSNNNMTKTYSGCQNNYNNCIKRLYRQSCIHIVLDYFEKVICDEV